MGAGPRQTDLRSKAVSPDRWRDPGLLFRRDSESSVSSYHSTPTNGSPQIRPTILEAMNLPLTPYPDSNAASSLLSPLPEVPDTPSSTLGQFGDLARKPNPSAAELVQKVHKSWRSQSREGHSRTQDSHSRTRSGRHQSQSRSRSEQRDVRDPPETRETLESRQRSLSRSTAKASIDPRDERESSLSRSSNHASVKDRHREREKERERERDRERETDRSQTSSHRRAASSKELRLLAHERNYDNDREIAATKVSMYLQSLAAQTPQPMPSPPQSNASQTPQPQSSQTPKPTAPPVQQIPSRAAVDTPIPAASHTPIPAGSHTPIPSVSAMSFASEPDRELLQENRGLYQRVAALQRTERDLLAENQELVRQLAVFKKHHETRHQQWKDEYQKIKEREKILLVEAQQLKQKIMRQEEQILDLAVANAQIENPAPGLSDRQITTWFAERDESWFSWARNFASHDPNRLSSGLHPLQLYEVCDGIKSFVKLTDDFKLPAELLVKGTDMIQAVLHGMLVNFICTETLSSPFWIFNAISSGSPESPFVAPATAISPGGFRLDLAMLNAIPSRTFPAAPVPTLQLHRDPRFPPPLITSNLQPGGMLSASSLAYPMKDEMENMFHMLTKAQTGEAGLTSVQLREAQLVQLFAESGMSIKSPQDAGGVEAKRMLIESRLNYARRLKERFLSGAARFLLQDQDPAGIANLERTLTDHIDDALRFSCQLWARPGPIRFHGFTALGGRQFKPSDRLMSLCHAQSPKAPVASALPAHLLGLGLSQAGPETPGPPGYYDGRPVVMVVQPAIEAIEVGGGGVGGRDDDPSKPRKISKVWLKARVLVAASSQEQTPSAPTTTNIGTTKVTMMTSPDPQATTPPESEKAFLIGPVPKSAVRASPKRTPSEQQGQFPAQVASYYTASLGHAIDSQSAPLEKMAGGISSLQQETALRTS